MTHLAVAALMITSLIPLLDGATDGIIKVGADCGSDSVRNANITIVTDMEYIHATAHCLNGVRVFTSADGENFNLSVFYPPSVSEDCLFNKRANKEVYYVNVAISYGNEIQQSVDSYTITCTFSPTTDEYSLEHGVEDGLFAPIGLIQYKGSNSAAGLRLLLTDVLGNDIMRRTIDIGRTLQIKVEALGPIEGVGIFPVSCDAVSGDMRYTLLTAGCGDGVIFSKDTGFTTSGLVSFSPYFKAFVIGGSTSLKFQCNVTICSSQCEGNTCHNERKRRSESSPAGVKYIIASTATSRLVHLPLDLDNEDNISKNTQPNDMDQNEEPGSPYTREQIQGGESNDTRGHNTTASLVQRSNTTASGASKNTSRSSDIPKDEVSSRNKSDTQTHRMKVVVSDVVSLIVDRSHSEIKDNAVLSRLPDSTTEDYAGNNVMEVESEIVFVTEGELKVNKGDADTSSNTHVDESGDKVTEKSPEDSEDLIVGGKRPVYIIGIVIAGLFAVASVLLSISLCRRRYEQS